jgi:hypothetical protein
MDAQKELLRQMIVFFIGSLSQSDRGLIALDGESGDVCKLKILVPDATPAGVLWV